jgi:hypothetical protein
MLYILCTVLLLFFFTLSKTHDSPASLNAGVEDLFSGEWNGLYNFDRNARDAALKEVGVPWVLRKMVGTLMKKEGKVDGVVRYIPGESLNRRFNFGILGQQNETYIISDDFEDFNGGFGKIHMKAKVLPDGDGRGFTVLLHRFKDAAKTIRFVNSEKGVRVGIQKHRLNDDDDNVMVCSECVKYEKSGEETPGWSYEMHRVQGGGGSRK